MKRNQSLRDKKNRPRAEHPPEWLQHKLKNELKLKLSSFQNFQNLTDYKKKLDSQEPKSCFVHKPAIVMVWAAITADGHFPLVVVARAAKRNAEYHRENILKAKLKL